MCDKPLTLTTVGTLLGYWLPPTWEPGDPWPSEVEPGKELPCVVCFGATAKHGADANRKAFLWLRQRCNGRPDPAVVKPMVRQVIDAEGISLARVVSMDFVDFRERLSAAPLRYGPDPDKQIIHWDGKPYPLTRLNWLLLKVVWGRYNAPFTDVAEAVWGDDSIPANRLRQALYRLNCQLADYGLPAEFAGKGECVLPLGDWPQKLRKT